MPASAPVLDVRGVTKTFPGVIANQDVDFALQQGEIHCLLGENGAGKSTLMNVIYGLYQPDAGEIRVRGERVDFDSSADAIAAGIGMVHQHFQLIPVFTVAENIVLGDEITRGPVLDLDTARDRIVAIGEQYGLEVDPDARVGDLSVGQQQRIELVKALFREADVLILDEPTAVLTPGEVDTFFGVVRSLVERGKSIVFITHKLREVLAVADRITVLRDGRVVGSADPAEATQTSLANLMVGREVVLEIDKPPARTGAPVLEVSGLRVADARGVETLNGIDLTVRGGEIYGVAGVEGNGQRELVESLAGMRPASSGSVVVDGIDISRADPRRVHDLDVGHVPEDRSTHGIVGAFSVADNLILNQYHLSPYAERGIRREGPVERHAEELVDTFDIRTSSIFAPATTLSGGNQQKVVIARELSRDLRLLLVAQPTRGLDVGSIEFIHRRLIEIRDAGTAVLLVSAELDEILSLADRIGVLYRGQIVTEVDRSDATREGLGLAMASGRAGAPA